MTFYSGRALRAVSHVLRLDTAGSRHPLPGLDDAAWSAVLQLANTHMLAPALAASLRNNGTLPALPRHVRNYLQYTLQQNRRRNACIRGQAEELVTILGQERVPALLLKGALTLVADCHGGSDTPVMNDIDVAVPAGKCGKAIRVLEQVGYRVADRYPDGHHAVATFTRQGDPAPIDLHVGLIDQKYLFSVDGVWQRASRMRSEYGAVYFAPSATDRILHSLLHEQIHCRGNFYLGRLRLGALYEFALLAGTYGAEVDWEFVARLLREHRLTTPLHSYLLAAGALFGLPWPLEARPSLSGRVHYGRCILQLWLPFLMRMSAPWGNLRAAFAWHRMRGLYRAHGPGLLQGRLYHAWQFLRRFGARQTVKRLFRA